MDKDIKLDLSCTSNENTNNGINKNKISKNKISKNNEKLLTAFNQCKIHFSHHIYPALANRKEQLVALKIALLAHQQELIAAVAKDYGHRARHDTLIADIIPIIQHINYTLKHLSNWIKPRSRYAGLMLLPAKVKVHYQPLGVVGIIVPWNFPINLSLSPLISVIAAGNVAMLKLSEFTPYTNKVLRKLLASVFDDNSVCVIEGDANLAADFSALPFDHLLFTGSSQVGKKVMQAASTNLTPVTLELGGKSPVIIAEDMPINTAVERLIYGKSLNAGQICVAPDYIFCHKNQLKSFIKEYQKQFHDMYQQVQNNPDYTCIINKYHQKRIINLMEDAKRKGAQIFSASSDAIDNECQKIATQLITHVTDDMLIMQEEIFGPLLPIVTYEHIDDAISYVNQHARPLALYIMSFDKSIQRKILNNTHSGGVCINDTVSHVAVDAAPFGGIGQSGMGHYHGKEGFLRFSHARTVLTRGHIHGGKLMYPPYNKWWQRLFIQFFSR